jgi:hypothetical protein
VSVPAQDSVITFPSFSAARAWPPKTSGISASAAILMMRLIAVADFRLESTLPHWLQSFAPRRA